MVKRDIVLSRVDKLKEYINFLENIKDYSKEDYERNPLVYGSSERFLHLAIECVLDIGNHIISDMRYRKPDSNRDIFQVLFENSILDETMKDNLCNMASFRNILVHDYLKLNRAMIYDIIQTNLCDLKKFINIIVEYL